MNGIETMLLAGINNKEANAIMINVAEWRVSLFFNMIYFQIQIAIAERILMEMSRMIM